MDKFTERQKKIIEFIFNNNDAVNGKDLALYLNCSVRTVQNEIFNINKHANLIFSSNKGYSINETEYINNVKKTFNTNKEKNKALKILLFSSNPIYIHDLSEMLFVSITTLEKTLKNYNNLLEKFELCILRNKGYISISGQELNKRRLIRYLIINESNDTFNNINTLNSYFDNIDLLEIKEFISNIITDNNYVIDKIYSNTLTISISIALYRMKTKHYIDSEILYISDENSIEYKIAISILNHYKEKLNLYPTQNDIQYIASLILGQIKPLKIINNKNIQKLIDLDFINEIADILRNTFSHYMLNIDFSKSIESFSVHIDGLIKRSITQQPAHNYSIQSLKSDHPYIYEVSVYIAKQISEKYNISINDSEIGFICIYIGYLLDNEINRKKITALFLCDNYPQIRDKLYNNLVSYLSDMANIINVTYDDMQHNLYTYDLIITTDKYYLPETKVIEISPFLLQNDIIKINIEIQNFILSNKLNNLYVLFLKFFSPSLFFINDDFNNKYDVIEFLAKKLVKNNIAEEKFIDSVIKRENISSTSFGGKYAIPHALDLDAKRTKCCILISRKGILWDDNKVNIVLMIAVHKDDRKNFIELYENIITVLENPKKILQLIDVSSFEEFKSILFGVK